MKFEIIAGDIPKSAKYVDSTSKPELVYRDETSKIFPRFFKVTLLGNIENIQVVTEENKKGFLGSAGWGLTGLAIGGLIAAPVAIAAGLAGLLKGGNKKEVCFACNLKDGRKFLALADAKIYQQLYALSDSNAPTPATHVRCPDCKELVLNEARVCKHCGCKLIPQA